MRLALASTILLVTIGAAQADRKPLVGDQVRLTTSFPGCTDSGVEGKMLTLFAKKDEDAAMAVFRAYADKCEIIAGSSEGPAEDVSFMIDATCVRPKGKPDCYWLPNETLERK